MMRSVLYYNPGDVRMGDIPTREIADGEIRVKIVLSGICGSDIKTYVRGTHYMVPPAVLGHEVVGTVAESKNGKWNVGDRVAVAHYIPCGSCEFCLSGKGTLCPELNQRRISPGGFTEYLHISRDLADRGTFKLSDDFDFYQAVLAEPLACCINGIRKLSIPGGASVLIIGDGPMGLLHAQAVRYFGAGNVMVSGVTEHRLAAARHYADHVIDARQENVKETAAAYTKGLGPDAVIVAVASVDAAKQALDIVRKGGSVLLFAGFSSGSELVIDPNRIHYGGINVAGSAGSLPEDFILALRLLELNKVTSEYMITHRYSLDMVPEALELGSKQEGVKSVVDPWAPDQTAERLGGSHSRA